MKQYEIPVIQSDLRHEEMIVQAINVFEHLDNVVNGVFNKIDEAIEKRLKKIEDLNTRIARANDKIDNLKGVKKSISIFSPAKYPAAEKLPEHQSIFADLNTDNVSINRDYKIEHSYDHLERIPNAEKLQFFHVRKPQKITTPTSSNRAFNIKSVNSTIIFNTNENILVKDKVENIRQTSKLKSDVEQQEIDITDFSRLSKKMRNRPLEKGIGYSPNMKDAPQLEVPIDLPDLPGIANDIHYEQIDKETLIAPSLATMNIIGDLPIPVELPVEASKDENLKTAEKKDLVIPSSVPPVGIPPPPPPVPEVLMKSISAVPPPPPPPPMPTALPRTEIASKPLENKTPIPQPDDARSNLMQAIRAAAGKALKKAASDIKPVTNRDVSKEPKKPVAKSSGGDLMGDLKEKLKRRREGISGANNQDDSGNKPGNILDSLASRIPPPPKKHGVSSEDESDNNTDWE